MSETHGDKVHFAHHFRSAVHEFLTCKLGMLLFLVQEVLFFSPLFVGYFMFKREFHESFRQASFELDWKMGALNTAILIFSSFTMAKAVTSAQRSRKNDTVKYLAITILCAFGFLIVKYFEYSHKIHLGILPGKFFTNVELLKEAPEAPLYFAFYFCMTGLHALHVIIGIGVLIWILLRSRRGDFNEDYFTPVEMTGLYWHFVDLVWIYLFPILYLLH